MSPPETRRSSLFTRDAGNDSPRKKSNIVEGDTEHKSIVLAALAAQVGGPTVRLWTVYNKAKKDFFAVAEPSSLQKQEAAKFLRDTAENLLHHLQDKAADQRLLDELNRTFEAAEHTAMTLHGGKKRKFDRPAPAALPKILADDSNSFWRGSAETRGPRGPRPHPMDTTRINTGLDKRIRAMEDVVQYTEYPSHPRLVEDYERRGAKPELPRDQRRFFAPEISSKNARVPKQKKRQPGRGHSGIPYGYTRPVDSYYPA